MSRRAPRHDSCCLACLYRDPGRVREDWESEAAVLAEDACVRVCAGDRIRPSGWSRRGLRDVAAIGDVYVPERGACKPAASLAAAGASSSAVRTIGAPRIEPRAALLTDVMLTGGDESVGPASPRTSRRAEMRSCASGGASPADSVHDGSNPALRGAGDWGPAVGDGAPLAAAALRFGDGGWVDSAPPCAEPMGGGDVGDAPRAGLGLLTAPDTAAPPTPPDCHHRRSRVGDGCTASGRTVVRAWGEESVGWVRTVAAGSPETPVAALAAPPNGPPRPEALLRPPLRRRAAGAPKVAPLRAPPSTAPTGGPLRRWPELPRAARH